MRGGDHISCPICKKSSTLNRKWTRKKSGKKYSYEVFYHGATSHWIRVGSSHVKRYRKNEVQEKIVELLNSLYFRRAVFTSNDIVEALKDKQFIINYTQARASLMKLSGSGFLSILRKDRKMSFVNGTIEKRLNYTVKKTIFSLEDVSEDGTFKRHHITSTILNDKEIPLFYMHFRITGDNARSRDQFSFSAVDSTREENATIYFLEDKPQDKSVLIVFANPIQSGEERTISIDYFWPERGPSNTFTIPTDLENMKFYLVSKK